MLARDRIEVVLEQITNVEFTGVFELGEPNVNVLGYLWRGIIWASSWWAGPIWLRQPRSAASMSGTSL
jgi:hypothetical protein